MPFTKGHTLSKGIGRPKGSKNLLPLIREKVLNALNKRIAIDRELRDVSTEELLQFARSIMPKEVNVGVAPSITYVSNTPRPEELTHAPQNTLPECKPEQLQEEVIISVKPEVAVLLTTTEQANES